MKGVRKGRAKSESEVRVESEKRNSSRSRETESKQEKHHSAQNRIQKQNSSPHTWLEIFSTTTHQ